MLIPPTSTFDELARPLIGRADDLDLRLKPMLVIVSNQSPRTIVSLSTMWTVRHADGRTFTMKSHASFPEFVCGDVLVCGKSEAIPPGSHRIEAMWVVIHGYGDDEPYFNHILHRFVVEKNQLVADATKLLIELDAVISRTGRSSAETVTTG